MKRLILMLMMIISITNSNSLQAHDYKPEQGAIFLNLFVFAKNGFKFDTQARIGLTLTGLAIGYRLGKKRSNDNSSDTDFGDFIATLALTFPIGSEMVRKS